MVWRSSTPHFSLMRDARPIEEVCPNCGNLAKHRLHRNKAGLAFGNPITGKPWASTKSIWVLMCEICEDYEIVSKEVAAELRGLNR